MDGRKMVNAVRNGKKRRILGLIFSALAAGLFLSGAGVPGPLADAVAVTAALQSPPAQGRGGLIGWLTRPFQTLTARRVRGGPLPLDDAPSPADEESVETIPLPELPATADWLHAAYTSCNGAVMLLETNRLLGESGLIAPPAPPAPVDPALLADAAPIKNGVWAIKRAWNEEELVRYGQWVEQIFDRKKHGDRRQKNARLDEILRDPEMNLFLQAGWDPAQNHEPSERDISMMRYLTHCGSFPKLLFVYYSYKRGLPCFISFVRGKGNDIRYSAQNRPTHYIDNWSFRGSFRQFLLNGINSSRQNHFTTGNYRTAPDLEETDSVPLAIDRKHLRPGTLAYNAGGHALLVGKVTEDGEVYFLDAHPDYSISYSKDLSVVTSVTTLKNPAACYGGFRAMRLAVVEKDDKGRAFGVRPMSNEEMKAFGYSLDQYEMMGALKAGRAEVAGRKISNFHEYVRRKLKNSDMRENPHAFIASSAQRLHDMFETRRVFVEEAWADVRANGPIVFPDESPKFNIYQAEGRWETWSSPSSDVDRKCAVVYVGERLESMIHAFREDPETIDLGPWAGRVQTAEDLAREIVDQLKQELGSRKIVYRDSTGSERELDLLTICGRLWDISFDPNHPPELRWGEPLSSLKKSIRYPTPLASGRNLTMEESYRLQQGLRYVMERQDVPTSLRPGANSLEPPERLPLERLQPYLPRVAADAAPTLQ